MRINQDLLKYLVLSFLLGLTSACEPEEGSRDDDEVEQEQCEQDGDDTDCDDPSTDSETDDDNDDDNDECEDPSTSRQARDGAGSGTDGDDSDCELDEADELECEEDGDDADCEDLATDDDDSDDGTCVDGEQNQGEIGVDCGGPCPACRPDATCVDGIQNQGETDIDCGGPCPACGRSAGESCDQNTDCSGNLVCHEGFCTNPNDIQQCETLHKCTYRHEYYSDGSGTIIMYTSGFDRQEVIADGLDACMNRRLYDDLSDLPESERCELLSCEVILDDVNCEEAGSYKCEWVHEHYSDGSGTVEQTITRNTLRDSYAAGLSECLSYELYGDTSYLPDEEACELISCEKI